MRLSSIVLTIAIVGCATQSTVERECRRDMRPGDYKLLASAKLKANGLSVPLDEGAVVNKPRSLRSYYKHWPEASKWAATSHPSVALFSTGGNGLVLCQVPKIACSANLTWLALGLTESNAEVGRVVERLEGVCVVSQFSEAMSPHNKSLERTRER